MVQGSPSSGLRLPLSSRRDGPQDAFRRKGLVRDAGAQRRSASLTATQTAPMAPMTPASPMPLAPSSVVGSGVSTCSTTMSGISPAMGAR